MDDKNNSTKNIEEGNDFYGMTTRGYRELLESETVKAAQIPEYFKKVYRYRRLETPDGEEVSHWEDDINGICMFSTPNRFNKNDPDDCRVHFDIEAVLEYMTAGKFHEMNKCVQCRLFHQLETYKDSLQDNERIGCFTKAAPTEKGMWDDPNFGAGGRGICIEYNIDDENFYPATIPPLPVLYDDVPFDSTKTMIAMADCLRAEGTSEYPKAALRMVCLGYGHVLIKPLRYKKEKEWRVVVPVREGNMSYFNIDHKSKRDFSSAITAIYLGPKFDDMKGAAKYREALENKWGGTNVKIISAI